MAAPQLSCNEITGYHSHAKLAHKTHHQAMKCFSITGGGKLAYFPDEDAETHMGRRSCWPRSHRHKWLDVGGCEGVTNPGPGPNLPRTQTKSQTWGSHLPPVPTSHQPPRSEHICFSSQLSGSTALRGESPNSLHKAGDHSRPVPDLPFSLLCTQVSPL